LVEWSLELWDVLDISRPLGGRTGGILGLGGAATVGGWLVADDAAESSRFIFSKSQGVGGDLWLVLLWAEEDEAEEGCFAGVLDLFKY